MIKTEIGNCAKPRIVVTTTDEAGAKVDVKVLPVSSKVKEALVAGGMPVAE